MSLIINISPQTSGKQNSFADNKELLNYQNQISDHFRWEQKNNFSEAMVDFLKNMINLDQYITRLILKLKNPKQNSNLILKTY
jgi:hypothetical protein